MQEYWASNHWEMFHLFLANKLSKFELVQSQLPRTSPTLPRVYKSEHLVKPSQVEIIVTSVLQLKTQRFLSGQAGTLMIGISNLEAGKHSAGTSSFQLLWTDQFLGGHKELLGCSWYFSKTPSLHACCLSLKDKTGEEGPWKQGSGPKEACAHGRPWRAQTTSFVSEEAANPQKSWPTAHEPGYRAGPNHRGHTRALRARHPTSIIPHWSFQQSWEEKRSSLHFKDKMQAVKWLN